MNHPDEPLSRILGTNAYRVGSVTRDKRLRALFTSSIGGPRKNPRLQPGLAYACYSCLWSFPGPLRSRVLSTFFAQLPAKNLIPRKCVTCHTVTSLIAFDSILRECAYIVSLFVQPNPSWSTKTFSDMREPVRSLQTMSRS